MTARERAVQAARTDNAAAIASIADRFVRNCEDAAERHRRGRSYLQRRLADTLAAIDQTYQEETTP